MHHVMVRGIDRTIIFRDDRDCSSFRVRLARPGVQGTWTRYAWALLPNQAHLLVRTGKRPLARRMRALPREYACAFKRRHNRVEHLPQE
jgi:hypothetical protein